MTPRGIGTRRNVVHPLAVWLAFAVFHVAAPRAIADYIFPSRVIFFALGDEKKDTPRAHFHRRPGILRSTESIARLTPSNQSNL